MNGGIPHPSIA